MPVVNFKTTRKIPKIILLLKSYITPDCIRLKNSQISNFLTKEKVLKGYILPVNK